MRPSNSATRPGAIPVDEPICVIRKPPFSIGKKSSVMLDSTALVENMNRGFLALVTSKKKIPFCPFNRLSSPPQPRTVLVELRWQWCGSLPIFPGRWKRHSCDDMSVIPGILVKVNDGQKVRRLVRLIGGPDVEHLFLFISLSLFRT